MYVPSFQNRSITAKPYLSSLQWPCSGLSTLLFVCSDILGPSGIWIGAWLRSISLTLLSLTNPKPIYPPTAPPRQTRTRKKKKAVSTYMYGVHVHHHRQLLYFTPEYSRVPIPEIYLKRRKSPKTVTTRERVSFRVFSLFPLLSYLLIREHCMVESLWELLLLLLLVLWSWVSAISYLCSHGSLWWFWIMERPGASWWMGLLLMFR